MRQIQVSVPEKNKKEAKEILQDYTTDLESSEVEKDADGRRKFVEFRATVDSKDIDELDERLKDIEDLESGELSVRILKQESLVRKGQKTQGSNSILSQAEVYSKAQEAAGFDRADWGLIVLSSVIASYGLVTENVIAVIGAMMLAPMLSPFVASAISLTVGDRKLLTESIKSGSLSILLAMAVSLVSVMPMPVEMNSLLSLVSEPSLAGIVLSVSVGAAAALTFVTGFRDQIAGVAVAIALVPPIASIGIGLKMQDLQLVTRASSVAAINLLAIIFSGFLCFKLLGLKPSTYYRKKQAEQIRYVIPAVLVVFGLIAAPVAFSSYQSYQEYVVEEQIEHQAEQVFGEKLLKANISGRKATLYVIGTVNEQDFRKSLPETAEVEIVRLQETS